MPLLRRLAYYGLKLGGLLVFVVFLVSLPAAALCFGLGYVANWILDAAEDIR